MTNAFAGLLYGRFPSAGIAAVVLGVSLLTSLVSAAPFVAAAGGQAKGDIVADTRGCQGANGQVLTDAAAWLADSINRATGAELPVLDKPGERPAIILARADQYPQVAARAGLTSEKLDAFCIASSAQRMHILGRTEIAVRHGVATLLHRLGFRWFNPSPRWWIAPRMKDLTIDLMFADAPALIGRKIWYAYGVRTDKPLEVGYDRWAEANRLGSAAPFHTGHSYGHIIGRNQEAFEAHPEYFALLPDGTRDTQRDIKARKLCYSNPGLARLVIADRIKLLEQNRQRNPYEFMVSMDPSDGLGTCHCPACAKIGTTTDRVIYLANQIAKALRQKHPDAWVGLYGYSSHRLPPTIDVEPNVYIQVAMGFNRTQYTLAQLIEKWAEKVSMIGLREYYGVEAWDWGLPGRMRGAHVDYHTRWIPYYAQRKVNALNAETNANWGAQTLGLLVASHMIWDPGVDVKAITDDYFEHCFGSTAGIMRRLQARFDANPPLRVSMVLPMLQDVEAAYAAAERDDVRRRLVDMMSYLHYVALFRDFSLVRESQPERNDAYYQALKPLMQYAWRTRLRGMVHYYALARRLCNGLPVRDKRWDFYMYNRSNARGTGTDPVWMTGEQLTDPEIVALFRADLERLAAESDPHVAYSRLIEWVTVPGGEDAGPCKVLSDDTEGLSHFRGELSAYLLTGAEQTVRFKIQPVSRSCKLTISSRGEPLFHKEYLKSEPTAVEVALPRKGDYPVAIEGTFRLHVPADVPLVFEASLAKPAWIDYSGPHYFYVPKGARQLVFDCSMRVCLKVPGEAAPRTFSPADRVKGRRYIVLDIPEGAAGKVWHTTNQTRGPFCLINVPPFLSFRRNCIVVPREVSQGDDLAEGWPR